MTSSTSTTDALTVLQSLSPPDGTTRYVDQIVGGAPPSVTMTFFSWRAALFGRYDVFHVHWPELMIRAGNPRKAMLRRAALRILLLRLSVLHVPIVRTVHNPRPHEAGSTAENRVLELLDRHTSTFIRLNPTTEVESDAPIVTVLHGHYRDRFASMDLPERQAGRILYFGLIRPYKGVETLLSVFAGLERDDLHLRVVGRPSGGLRPIIVEAQEADDRISSRLEFVSDEDLVGEVGQAALVVLPYREMHNSGAILVALSLDRPVLVPRTPSNEALATEVGVAWVQMYDGELTGAILERAVAAAPDGRTGDRPRLEGRDWSTIGQQAREVYAETLDRVRPGRRA